MSPDSIIGWDLGGAHLKAAHLNAKGCVFGVVQLPCPLWRGIDNLRRAVDEVLDLWSAAAGRHAVTMTGEMTDLFSTRAAGVRAMADVMHDRLSPAAIELFAGMRGFLAPCASRGAEESIASANWLASATFVARHLTQALFIDVGSTTTDIVAVKDGRVPMRGMNDHERMRHGELVYSGVVRTPLMAVAQRAPFAGAQAPLMAEPFAVSADVYRLTGELPALADQYPAADGGPKNREGSARRIARMLGLDLQAATMHDWCCLAQYFSNRQFETLLAAVRRALSREDVGTDAPLVGAGVGRFLVRRLARSCGRRYVDLSSLFNSDQLAMGNPADCAPAVAVAWLAGRA